MSSSPSPALSIVVPAYREALRLPHTLELLAAFAQGFESGIEILLVVEESDDGTLELARECAARHPQFVAIASEGHHGKGRAVRTGMLRAKGELVLFMDADLSVPLAEVFAFQRYLAEHPEVDVLIGDRQHAASKIERRQAFLRERMGQIFNVVVRRLAGIRWRDTQCGFKAFRRRAAQDIFQRQVIDGFAFDVEVLLLAERRGFRVESHPVTWINSTESKVRIVADSLRMLRDAWRVRRLLRKGYL